MDNPIRGLHYFRMLGKTYTLQYTWDNLEAIEAEYGSNGPQLGDFTALAKTASVGMVKFHPEMTPEHIRELNPPVFVLMLAVQQALKYAYHGKEGDDTPNALEEAPKKKQGLWSRFIGFLSGLAARQQNFGN